MSEVIKKAHEKWNKENGNMSERNDDYGNRRAGFYAGYKAAEAEYAKGLTECFKCGKLCDPKEEKSIVHKSFLHRENGQWKAHCYPCYQKSKEADKVK